MINYYQGYCETIHYNIINPGSILLFEMQFDSAMIVLLK